jgi:hypothetical protein
MKSEMVNKADTDVKMHKLCIKMNNCASNDPCGICGERTEPEIGSEVFLEGTNTLVCWRCANIHNPELVKSMADAAQSIMKFHPKPSLGDVLEKYIRRGLHPYNQFDGFTDVIGDSVMKPDVDKDTVFHTQTWDAMGTSPTVRVLIPPNECAVKVLRVLKKVSEWIEREPDILQGIMAGKKEDDLPF